MCFGNKQFVAYVALMTLTVMSFEVHIAIHLCAELLVTHVTFIFLWRQCQLWVSWMHIFFVGVTMCLTLECPSTVFTHEWPFVCVTQLMFIQCCVRGKAFPTNLTHIMFPSVAATIETIENHTYRNTIFAHVYYIFQLNKHT